jgi:hydrogenase maturation protease
MARTLIIGYGNPLRGDDGLGWHAARRLRERIADPDVGILALHQLTPELADDLSRADLAIFIDAACEGEPGSVCRRRVEPSSGEAAFTHHATPEALLSAARALFGRAPDAVLFTAAVESVELSERLTPAAERALERIVAEVIGLAPGPGAES